MAVIAVVFDFDDTLVPDSTSALLQSRGIDVGKFWSELVPRLVEDGYDPPLAYLRLILDRIGAGKPLGTLSNQDLRGFGESLDGQYFDGLPGMFNDLRGLVAQFRDVSIEFYIVSGGLQEVIAGSHVVQSHFNGLHGCQLGESDDGEIRFVKRCVTFTEKTRYLFEINKGIRTDVSRRQPHAVNNKVARRRVPFSNMIYVGDGLTDIPCFSLVREGGGRTFGVLAKNKTAKQAFEDLLQERRVDSLHSPDYRENADLGALIRAAVYNLATTIDLGREQA